MAFNELYKRGLIKNIGICNARIETMKEYQEHLDYPIFASQCQYNLIAREPQRIELLKFCKDNNINFISWGPIQLPARELGIESLHKKGAYPLLDEIADKYGKTNAQIAVRWLTGQDNVNIIFKSTNSEHIKEILETTDFVLSDEDMQDLRDNFPRQEDEGFIGGTKTPLV